MKRYEKRYEILKEELGEKGFDLEKIKNLLKAQVIELPSWAVGNSGTRYGTFKDKGAAVTIWDKIDDCAEIQRCLGITPVMASHVCWDKTEDGRFGPVREYAEEKGMKIGTVHPGMVPCVRRWTGYVNRRRNTLKTASEWRGRWGPGQSACGWRTEPTIRGRTT